MNPDLAQALAYDPISDAEKRMGKSYKEDDSVTWLAMALMQDQRKTTDALIFLNRDTNSMRQTIPEFFDILADMGFREVLKLAIEGTSDHFHVFWKPGLLLRLDTYMGRSVNSGTCYFNYRGPRDAINGSNGWIQDTEHGPAWSGDTDIREGLRHKLDTMAEAGELLEDWIKQPFLWLLHYMDTKVEGYDHKAITAERIAMLPEDVRTAISGMTPMWTHPHH
jgi:hypothetical protein